MGEKIEPISTRGATTYIYNVFRFLGLDNLNRTWPYIIYSLQLNFSSCVLQLIGYTTSYVISSSTMSMDTFLTSLQAAINVYAIVLKITVMYLYMPRLRKTGPIFDALDVKIRTKEEREIAEKMISFCRRLVVIYTTSYMAYSSSTLIAGLVNGHPPYAIYIPYCHWQESTLKMDVSLDSYGVIFTYMARMHTKILCIRVEQLGKDLTKSNEENEESLIDCIDTHRKILEVIEIVRPIIAFTVFIQFIVTAVIVGIALINIMMFANLSSAIGSFFFILAITMETLPMCYTMNVLMDEINNLPNSIFHSEWFGQSKSFRRMMIFFMQNAQKFNTIIAGNILPIQVSTFLSIAKLAFSIYALVHKMEERRSAHAALGIE